MSARRSLWQTEDEAGGSRGTSQDVGAEEGCAGNRQTLQGQGSTPSFVSRQQLAWETRWEHIEGAGLPGSPADQPPSSSVALRADLPDARRTLHSLQ